MTDQQDLRARIAAAVDYSHNFATAKPNIGRTEKEHILGLVALVREAAAQLGPVDEPVAEITKYGYLNFLPRHKAKPGDKLYARPQLPASAPEGCHKLDTDTHVFFYEQDFYVLSNFSAFTLQWKGRRFDTSEAAYHWEKFIDAPEVQDMLLEAPSAHEAFKLAETQKVFRRSDWDSVKVGIMREILRAKASQHEYVRRKLLATGNRILVEDSWRDDYWGWGPNRDGQNMLGKLWMEVREELRAAAPQPDNKESR